MSLKTLFRWHLWLGLISGAFMFVICLTGAIAVFAQEIDWLVIPPLRVKPPANPAQADEDAALAAVRTAYPDSRVSTLTLSKRPSFAHVAAIQTRRDGRPVRLDVYVNPYTATVQGSRVAGGGYFSSVYQFLRQTHVRLLMGLWGRVFVGVCGVSLVLSCITGLWIYRGWIKKMFMLRLGGGWGNRPPWAELHKFIGVWSLLFNVVIGLTGAVLGLENLANQIEQKWLRSPAQKPPAAAQEADAASAARPSSSRAERPVATLLADAKKAFPDFAPRVILFPARSGGPISIRGEVPGMLVAQSHVRSANSITLDSTTGAVLRVVDGRKNTGWTRAYWAVDPLHFGYFGGLPTKVIWFVLGLTPSVLAVTGSVMWWQRRARASAPSCNIAPAPSGTHRTRWGVTAVTLLLAYGVVARALNDWSFNARMAELWLVKPVSLALCAFPLTGMLVWAVASTRPQPWVHGGMCVVLGAWYLVLTQILIP